MILPEVNILFKPDESQKEFFYGDDTIDTCLDKKHFLNYPHEVTYNFNNRGFRDDDWPDTKKELENCIWCFGDSFTFGIGQPYETIWSKILQYQLNKRTINVSLGGASNEWISKMAVRVLNELSPKYMIIMWSYMSRREHPNKNLSDRDRRIKNSNESLLKDCKNWLKCYNSVNSKKSDIIHFSIPKFCPNEFNGDIKFIFEIWDLIKGKDWPRCPTSKKEFLNLPKNILNEVNQICRNNIEELFEIHEMGSKFSHVIETKQIDYGRDGVHYDRLTCEWISNRIQEIILQGETK